MFLILGLTSSNACFIIVLTSVHAVYQSPFGSMRATPCLMKSPFINKELYSCLSIWETTEFNRAGVDSDAYTDRSDLQNGMWLQRVIVSP